MTKGEAFSLYETLDELDELHGALFSYGVARNMSILRHEVKALEEARAPRGGFKKFEKERIALAEEYADRDETGRAKKEKVGRGERYILEKNYTAFMAAFEALKEKYKEDIEKYEVQMAEYEALLKEESDAKLYLFPLSVVPENITPKQMKDIYNVIIHEDL